MNCELNKIHKKNRCLGIFIELVQYCINWQSTITHQTRFCWVFFFVAIILCLHGERVIYMYWSCCFVGNLSDDGDDPSHLINNRGIIDDEDGKT